MRFLIVAFVGLAAGALLPMTAYRLAVPREQPDRTTCHGCGETLPGWVRLPARCGRCRTWWGPRPWWTAAAGAAAAALLDQQLGDDPALPLFVAVSVLCVLLGAIDLRCQRLPNVLVEPAIVVFTLAFGLTAAVTDEWSRLGRALLGAVVLGAVFGVLYLLPGGLGLGDVKVAGLLGLFLGWLGWGAVGLGALLPWLLNGPVVVGLLLARRVNRRTTLPFGPALMVGCLAALPVSEWLHLVARS